MSNTEYMSVQKAMDEVREGQKELLQEFYNFKLDISDTYQKKIDCVECRTHNSTTHNNLRNWIVGTYGFMAAVGALVISVWKGGK